MTRTRGAVSFTVSHVHTKGKQIHVLDALVLTTDVPASPVDSISQWKHLTGLDLADLEFGMPGCIDVLLGADYYGEILIHDRLGAHEARLRPRGCAMDGSWPACFNKMVPGQQRTPTACL